MPDIYNVPAIAEDGYHTTDDNVWVSDGDDGAIMWWDAQDVNIVGSSNGGNDKHSGLRFTNIIVNQGAYVSLVELKIYAFNIWNSPRIRISVVDEDDAAAFTTSNLPINSTKSTAYTDYDFAPDSTGENTGLATYFTFDITSAVQEIINRVGWVSGNAIAITIDPTTSGNTYLALSDSTSGVGYEPILEITISGDLLINDVDGDDSITSDHTGVVGHGTNAGIVDSIQLKNSTHTIETSKHLTSKASTSAGL